MHFAFEKMRILQQSGDICGIFMLDDHSCDDTTIISFQTDCLNSS
jgi:hypothetical protein